MVLKGFYCESRALSPSLNVGLRRASTMMFCVSHTSN